MSIQNVGITDDDIVLHRGAAAFEALRDEWDALAESGRSSPFASHAWLSAFLAAFGDSSRTVCVGVRRPDGSLRAGVCLVADRRGGLSAPTNAHSDDWDVVTADEEARAALWRAVAALRPGRVVLNHLIAASPSVPASRRALTAAGYRVVEVAGNRSPYLQLPASHAELLGSVSRNLRSQVARRGRQLERRGRLELRTVTGGPALDPALDALFRIEASGWKGRHGTAILIEPGAETAYRRFAHAAAARGWLRVHLLELDGGVIAGDLGCSIGGTGFLIKTGFDEEFSQLSPGLVLRGRVLEAAIAEGLRAYDFLGPDDDYKLRWTSTVRPRVTLRAYRGAAVVPGRLWWRAARPALSRGRAALLSHRRSAARPGDRTQPRPRRIRA